jgi:hypothetical protein
MVPHIQTKIRFTCNNIGISVQKIKCKSHKIIAKKKTCIKHRKLVITKHVCYKISNQQKWFNWYHKSTLVYFVNQRQNHFLPTQIYFVNQSKTIFYQCKLILWTKRKTIFQQALPPMVMWDILYGNLWNTYARPTMFD